MINSEIDTALRFSGAVFLKNCAIFFSNKISSVCYSCFLVESQMLQVCDTVSKSFLPNAICDLFLLVVDYLCKDLEFCWDYCSKLLNMGSCVSHCSRQDIVHQQTGRSECYFLFFIYILFIIRGVISFFSNLFRN